MREPASREVPLMASVGLLLDQAVISAGAARRGEPLTELIRAPLEELAQVVRGAAELETAPLGISRQARFNRAPTSNASRSSRTLDPWQLDSLGERFVINSRPCYLGSRRPSNPRDFVHP